MASYQYTTEADCPRPIFSFTSGGLVQGSETRVDNQNNPAGFFWVNPAKKHGKKTHPKFNPVSYLVT